MGRFSQQKQGEARRGRLRWRRQRRTWQEGAWCWAAVGDGAARRLKFTRARARTADVHAQEHVQNREGEAVLDLCIGLTGAAASWSFG